MVATPSLSLLLASFALAFCLGLPASAQDRATLVADNLQIEGDSVLIAEGGVEVFFQGRRLTASRIVYDQSAGRLIVEGPIRLTDETGDTVILANQADLAADMTEGLLTSARVVLNSQLQMASAEARRIGGRYLQLEDTVASSCRVCAEGDTPLWEIRARRVTHDQQERQIYFDRAQLRLAGVPVFYIPRLRLPDPTLKRANGFLLPKFSGSTTFGTGIELPYFLTLGASRDVTVTPFLTSDKARSLTLRYRQAFENGDLTVVSGLAGDQTKEGLRGYLFADGSFALPNSFQLTFHGELVSDRAYLTDYDISDADRLTSFVVLTRVRHDELVYGNLRGIKSLRTAENASSIPSIVGDALWQKRFTGLGGMGNLRFASHGHLRRSISELDTDGDTVPDGRDVARSSIGADWRRDWVLPGGVLGAVLGETRLDFYDVAQDPVFAGSSARLWGAGGVELRWPLVKNGKDGARHVLEPVLQIIAAEASDANIPNEDSILVEFDEASLMSLNRYPGSDAVETGLHANLGLSWTRYDPDGWSLGATVGQVLRAEANDGFSAASGFAGDSSLWLASVHFETGTGLYASGRIIADETSGVARGEIDALYYGERLTLSSGYIWSVADADEFRGDDISELVMFGGYKLTDNWSTEASGRYDLIEDSASRAALGLKFKNECVLLDLSLSRRFSTSTSVLADTRFGVTLELTGFGGGESAGPAQVCRR
ncbi:LPS-assembly protein LptD [Gemmobacter aquarius]|uniref:LPS-assembly protein LptD n=1 Tax=Paragemmobacter aquarius TaxID=2169400 RepID=A0A2S0ULC1_9RHOB|nr:LPS assembly protein LptD [Gemmobacter aquarius]AWB48624.1 LPS-assembly protein LptD [Gemmobacter aquarius]